MAARDPMFMVRDHAKPATLATMTSVFVNSRDALTFLIVEQRALTCATGHQKSVDADLLVQCRDVWKDCRVEFDLGGRPAHAGFL